MKTILHEASTRGYFDHGWLRTHHSFSFADYYDPARISFGVLRVLNDDSVDPGMGFPMHPHRDMEIVSIPLSGELLHEDDMGNSDSVKAGEIQVMSAGTGISHSEYARQGDAPTDFLQIWVIPDRKNHKTRYENARIADLVKPGGISTIVSPFPGDGKGLRINQRAWFSIADLKKGDNATYRMKSGESFGVYAFIIEGAADVAGQKLGERDGLGVYDTKSFDIAANAESRILLIEVPFIK